MLLTLGFLSRLGQDPLCDIHSQLLPPFLWRKTEFQVGPELIKDLFKFEDLQWDLTSSPWVVQGWAPFVLTGQYPQYYYLFDILKLNTQLNLTLSSGHYDPFWPGLLPLLIYSMGEASSTSVQLSTYLPYHAPMTLREFGRQSVRTFTNFTFP
jgi:hypothetical protein